VNKWGAGQDGLSGPEFPEILPEFVYIRFLRYKVKPYIPQAIPCNKFQAYGHTA